jgi:hypothetical protein
MIKVEQAPSARVRRSCFRCVLPAGNQILRGARGSIQLSVPGWLRGPSVSPPMSGLADRKGLHWG